MNVDKKIYEKIKEKSIRNRLTAVFIVLSFVLGIFVPYFEITPSMALASEAFTEQQMNKPNGAVELTTDKITGFSNSGNITYSENKDYASVELTLSYEGMNGVTDSQPYIWHQLPDNVGVVNGGLYGTDKVLKDSQNDKWNQWAVSNNDGDDTAGYYSVADNGLIVMRFTKAYIEHGLGNNNTFNGSLRFQANVGRSATASGDQTLNINGHEITIEFDDMVRDGSKTSAVQTDENGNLKIHYAITIDNPGGLVDLQNYVLNDKMFSGDVRNLTTNPSGIGNISNNSFVFSNNPNSEKIVIEYDYYPTSEEILNLSGELDNEATLVNKTNPNDKATTTNKTLITPDNYKASASKNGHPLYEDGGELGKIMWEEVINRPHNMSLKNYYIVDDAFKTAELTLTDISGQQLTEGNDYTIDKSNGTIKILADICNVKIAYFTDKDNNGNSLNGNQGVYVKNSVSIYPPDNNNNQSNTPDDTDEKTVYYSERTSISKNGTTSADNLKLNAYLKQPESENITLDWSVRITDFSNFSSNGKPYVDTLGDGQYMTSEQFDAISIDGLTKGTDYTITPTKDSDNKITGFQINFIKSTSSRTLTLTYSTTADVTSIENGGIKSYTNKGAYDGVDITSSQTVTRDSISGSQNIAVSKQWVDAPADHGTTYLLLQYSTDNTNWYTYKPSNDFENPKESNGIQNWYSLPITVPGTDTQIYYRVIETDANGNEQVPKDYTVSYSTNSIQATENNYQNITVTNTYNYMSVAVYKNWSGVPDTETKPAITYKLYQKTGESGEWQEFQTKTISEGSDSYNYIFDNLPKTDTDGNILYYKVEETAVDGYKSSYIGDEPFSNGSGSVTFTNTYDKVAVKAVKSWVGDSGYTSDRVDVTVKLQSSTNPNETWTDISSANFVPGYQSIELEKTLTSNNSWSDTWSGLPRTTSDGNTIYYRIVETSNVENYTQTIETSDAVSGGDNYELTCTVQNTWNYINLTPVKVWSGDEGHTENRKTVTMKLQIRHKGTSDNWLDDWTDVENTNQIIIEKTDSDTWTAENSWTKLPKTDNNGNCYYRAVEVTNISGYVESDSENGTNSTGNSIVTNTYNYITLTPQKKWSGDSWNKEHRESVTFKLQYLDGSDWKDVSNNAEITISKQEGDTWTASNSWENLPKTDDNNNEIQYRMVETSTNEYYTAEAYSNTTNNTGTLSITNTYNNIQIKAHKEWSGDSGSDREGLSVTLELQYKTDNGNWTKYTAEGMTNPVTVEADTSSSIQKSDSWVWTDLPKTIDGKNVQYQIVESSIKGYSATYSPATLSESGEIKVTNNKYVSISKTALLPEKDDIDGEGGLLKNRPIEQDSISASDMLKYVVQINGEDYYLFKWKVEPNSNDAIDMVDTLPEGSIYYSNNNSLGYRLIPCYTWSENNIYDQGFNYENQHVEYPYNGNTNQIRFFFNSGSQIKYFTYFTATPKSIIDEEIAKNGYYTLKNSIAHTGTDTGDEATFTIGKKGNTETGTEVITKQYKSLGSDKINARARYVIEVNPDSVKLSNEDYLYITDIFEVLGYEVENKKTTDSGLLDAILSYIHVENLDKLDSNGYPVEVTDYSYVTETKTVVDKTKTFNVTNGSDNYWTKFIINDVSPDDSVTFTLSSNSGKKFKAEDVKVYMKNQYGEDIVSTTMKDLSGQEYLDFTTQDSLTFTIKVPKIEKNNQPISKITIEGYESTTSGNVAFNFTCTSAEKYETHIYNYIYLQVPDETHLRISYYYDLKTNENTPESNKVGEKPPTGAKIYFSNSAMVNTSNGSQTSDAEEKDFEVVESSGDVNSTSPPHIVKVNIANQNIRNLNATFKLAKYDTTNSKWIYATSFTETEKNGDTIGYGIYEITTDNKAYIPTGVADLVVTGEHALNLEEGVLYKIVETVAPTDYAKSPYVDSNTDINSNDMQDFIFYFIYGSSATAEQKNVVGDAEILTIAKNGSANIKNVNMIDVKVDKSWSLSEADKDKSWESTFTLYYYTGERKSTIPYIPTSDNDPNSLMHRAGELKDINGDQIIDTCTIKSTDTDKTHKWENIPNGLNGSVIYYYVVETSYKVGETEYKLQSDGTYKADDGTVGTYRSIYSNNGLSNDGTVNYTNGEGLKVTKVWKNSDNTTMETPPRQSVTFTLQGKKGNVWETIQQEDGTKTWTITADTWLIEIPNELLEGYTDFQVIEDTSNIPYGYTVSYKKNLNGSTGIIEITNKNPYVSEITFIVNKKWNDGLTSHTADITGKLYRATTAWADSANPTAEELQNAYEVGSFTLNDSNGWSTKWDNLPNIQKSGEQYIYYAVEENVPNGYIASYERSGNNSVKVETITNTPEEKPGNLMVQKVWKQVASSDMPENITLELWSRLKPLTTIKYNIPTALTVACAGDSITYGEMNNSSYPNVTYPQELYQLLSDDTAIVENHGHNNFYISGLQESDAKVTKDNSQVNADIVCLMIGTNNILHPENGGSTPYVNQLKEYINKIKTDSNVIFVASIPYFNNKNYTSGTNLMAGTSDTALEALNNNVDTYNADIAKMVSESNNNKLVYVDVNSVVDKDTMLADGIHPNAEGYKAIAEKFYEAIGNYYGTSAITVSSETPTDIDGVPSDLATNNEYKKVQDIQLSSANEWSVTLDNLVTEPAESEYSSLGLTAGFKYEYIYYVKETTSSEKWQVSYAHNGQPARGQMAITVMNTGSAEPEKTSLSVKKEWNSNNTGITATPDSVKLKLQKKSETGANWTDVNDSTVTIGASEDWKHTWDNLEAGLYYQVVEVDSETGWTPSYSDNNGQKVDVLATGEQPSEITVTNTLDVGNLEIDKLWLNDSTGDNTQVQIELYRQAYDEKGNPVTEQGNQVNEINRFKASSGLVTLSRARKAIAELSAQNTTEEEISETVNGVNLSVGAVDNVKILESETNSNNQYYKSLTKDDIKYGEAISLDSLLSGIDTSSIYSIEVLFSQTGWINATFQFGSGWSNYTDVNQDVVYVNTVVPLNMTNDFSTLTIYKNHITAEIKEIRFYYTPSGPTINIDNKNVTEVIAGDTNQLTASASEGATITWSSDKTNVATVDKNGKVTFIQVSNETNVKITVTATDSGGLTATDSIIYTVSPFKIDGESTIEIIEGGSKVLKANASASWEVTSGSAYVAVDSNGTLTGIKWSDTNYAVITAKHGNATDTIQVKVNAKDVDLSSKVNNMHIGGTAPLSFTDGATITITNENNQDVTSLYNSSTKTFTPIVNGTYTITATRNGKTANKLINVIPLKVSVGTVGEYVTEIENINMNINGSQTLAFQGQLGELIGTTTDDSIASYSNGSIVSGTKEGTATITLTDNDGYGGNSSVTIKVTVTLKEVVPDVPDSAEKVTGLSGIDENGKITVSAKNWKAMLNNLPVTDGKGNTYHYFIKEESGNYKAVSYNDGKSLTSGNATLSVTNYVKETSSGNLPSSGGTGTKLYYTIGGILLLLSATGYVTAKRRRCLDE